MVRTASRDRAVPDEADLLDTDVPAAVLCMVCGRTDCTGCSPPDRARLGATPWEKQEGSAWRRLWLTARLATVDGEAFFGALPDGSVTAALGFAFSCEVL